MCSSVLTASLNSIKTLEEQIVDGLVQTFKISKFGYRGSGGESDPGDVIKDLVELPVLHHKNSAMKENKTNPSPGAGKQAKKPKQNKKQKRGGGEEEEVTYKTEW